VLILASRSPQRRAILEQLGVPFEVFEPDVDELESGDPDVVAVENAKRKALAGARALADSTVAPAGSTQALVESTLAHPSPVLGVDTVVALEGRIYGKPHDPAAARQTLSELSGRRHVVVSAIAVSRGAGAPETAVERSSVQFRTLDADLIDWYVSSEEWRERAGGYAIQGRGAALVEHIEGDYLNVVGLPVGALLRLIPDLLRIP
jgi:septum formation protein